MTRCGWVAARRAEGFPTALCCGAAGISRQAFYGHQARQAAGPTRREAAAALVGEIREIHAATDGTYGSPRVTAELRARGRRVSPQARRPAHESPPDRRVPATAAQAHHHTGAQRCEAARPGRPPVRPRGPGPGVVLGHHLRAHRAGLAVSGGGVRPGQPTAAGLRHERTHRRPARRRRARHGRRSPPGPNRGNRVSLRPRQPIPRQELTEHDRRMGTGTVSGPRGVLSGQRRRRGVLHPASNESSYTGAATPTEPQPAGRSSSGSPATTPPGATPASTTSHPTSTNTDTVNPRATSPPYPPDKQTGGSASLLVGSL